MPAPLDTTFIPTVRSYLLGRTVQLDQLSDLSLKDLELLNIETLAALQEARHQHSLIEDKQSEDAGSEYKRIKINGYFQAAIQLELDQR
jgi:hypothetical protein